MDESRFMTVIFREQDRAGIEKLADSVSMLAKKGGKYGRHPSRRELRELVKLGDGDLGEVRGWFESYGMKVVEQQNPNPQRLVVEATSEQIKSAFGEDLADWRELDMDVRRAPRIALPGRLSGHVQKISAVLGDLTKCTQGIYGLTDHVDLTDAGPDQAASSRIPAQSEPNGGLTPRDVKEIYNFPDAWDGTGETIALQMLGGEVDVAKVQEFWQAHGIQRSDPEILVVRPQRQNRPQNPIHDFEAMMSVEWAGAMAPGARLVVYGIDPYVYADPWATFLMELIADEKNTPTVASTSWVTPERDYYRKHGHKVIVGLLAQAACLGLSVVSAAGDWGPFDGIPSDPSRKVDGRYVADAPWPRGVFPAVEEAVLGVGGTMVTVRDPLTEMAWSGPLPLVLQSLLPQMRALAGSGGFSDAVPIPPWQKDSFRSFYPRGTGSPAVVPYGRGFPDVALMASGPAIQPPDAKSLSCRGYQALTREGWVDSAVGTSVGAPIWAAILAIANQARRQAGNGLGPVGWVNPVLYQLQSATPRPFRPVLAGSADAVMLAANERGQAVPYHFDGYECRDEWDPVTGLGVPDVAVLVDHLRAPQPA